MGRLTGPERRRGDQPGWRSVFTRLDTKRQISTPDSELATIIMLSSSQQQQRGGKARTAATEMLLRTKAGAAERQQEAGRWRAAEKECGNRESLLGTEAAETKD